MKTAIDARRRTLLENFVSTWSVKSAVKATAQKFPVSEATLRVDWHRRHQWPKEVFDQVGDAHLKELYQLGIHRTLQQIEHELTGNPNPSCRVGLLKAKAEILFRLIEVQTTVVREEVLLKRIEALETQLHVLEHDRPMEGT